MRPTDHSAGDQSRSRAVSLFFAIYYLQGKEKNIHPHNLERIISIFHLLLEPHFPCRPHSPLFLTSPSHFFSPYKYSPKPLPRGLNLSLTKISSPQLSLSLSRTFQTFMESNHNKNTETIKFLCSYGGKILPRYTDGALRYAGGLTRVLAVDRSISFTGLFDFSISRFDFFVNLFGFFFVNK